MSREEWPYHRQLPTWPKFTFGDKDIDGSLPSCRVDDWEHFMQCMMEPYYHEKGYEIVYRGQRQHDWGLSSALSRHYHGDYIPNDDRKKMLQEFRLATRGLGSEFKHLDEQEIWAYGQHNGLHTPLLDWSKSPFVALYFAFVEQDNDSDNTSRTIFCLNRSLINQVMPQLFYEPTTNESMRILNQAGLFTMTPAGSQDFVGYIIEKLEEDESIDFKTPQTRQPPKGNFKKYPVDEIAINMSQYLCKIHIPNIGREECLNMLRLMNIHHRILFPDLFGAVNYTNDWLHRKIIETRPAESGLPHRTAAFKRLLSSIGHANGPSVDDLIKKVIREAVNEDIASDEMVNEWVLRITRYHTEMSMLTRGWPRTISARIDVREAIFRMLESLGAGSTSEILARKIDEIFYVNYRSERDTLYDEEEDWGC